MTSYPPHSTKFDFQGKLKFYKSFFNCFKSQKSQQPNNKDSYHIITSYTGMGIFFCKQGPRKLWKDGGYLQTNPMTSLFPGYTEICLTETFSNSTTYIVQKVTGRSRSGVQTEPSINPFLQKMFLYQFNFLERTQTPKKWLHTLDNICLRTRETTRSTGWRSTTPAPGSPC